MHIELIVLNIVDDNRWMYFLKKKANNFKNTYELYLRYV